MELALELEPTPPAPHPHLIVDRVAPRFVYAERVYYLREEDRGEGWSAACPICEKRYALRPTIFLVIVDAARRVEILQTVRCPTRDCGWKVKIRQGLALDVD